MNVGLVRANRAACLGYALLFLYGCGGGGGNPPATPTTPPTISLTAAQNLIQEGQSTELTWSSTNATTCSASGGWTGQLAVSGTQSTGPLSTTTTFTLGCSGTGGASQSSTVVTIQPIQSSVTLVATPRVLRGAQTSQLTWTSTGVSACEALGAWSGERPTSGSGTVGPFIQSAQHSYILQCTPISGGSVSDGVLVEYRTGINMPPTADAGPDLTVVSTQSVELVAGFSSDDHGIESWRWTQTSGPSVTLQSVAVPINIGFIAPMVTSDTVLTFALTLTDDEGVTSAPDSVNVTVRPIPPIVTLTGDVQFESVPHGAPGAGLAYGGQGFVTTRAAFVEVLNAATQHVVASGLFTGDFQFDVPGQTDLVLRATAQLMRQAPAPLPHWQVSVRDLDAAGASLGEVYSYTGPTFNSGAGGTRSLQIPSGWNGSGQLTGQRHAAPFAILNAVWLALEELESLSPRPSLPPVVIDWAPGNVGGQTFYVTDGAGQHRIVLSGEVNVDTDEYDSSVVLHEFGHFFMSAVSRDESIGGQHGFGDRVDMRVAYSEGFATAFGALVSGNTAYLDSFGHGQSDSGFFNVDSDTTLNEGWYNEFSVHELLWRVRDLQAIWETLQAPMQQTDAFTSVFPFFTALKQLRPSAAGNYDVLLAGEQIVGPTMSAFGTTEINNAGSANVLPIYGSIVSGGSVQVHSTNEFGVGNRLATHRHLRFSLPAAANVRFQVSAAAGRDPDIEIFRRGVSLGPPQGAANEDFLLMLDAGEYVLDVFDCGNADCNPNVAPAPTDITVSITAN
ncbi:MAG: PKD domain-containing protein [Steroidobacter sp.]